ncbi:MAG: endonuclease III [Candidatus Thorarchaeota archaeon]|nr:MAG: endonuclease III [Candidatus Thorarchaeota archaeon]
MQGELEMTEKERIQRVIQILEATYPGAPATYLNYRNAFEMLIATILSAHTADACVNTITPGLFKRFPDPESMMMADINDLIELIRPCGTYNRKAAYLRDTAAKLMDRFSGEVPRTLDELVELSGVSRKTANVVLSVVFGINEGVVVDTHVMRVTQKLGLTKEMKNRNKAERDLMNLLPKEQWYDYARLVGAHGRRTCIARRPKCPDCTLNHLCPSAEL